MDIYSQALFSVKRDIDELRLSLDTTPPKSAYQKRREFEGKTPQAYQGELQSGRSADDIIGEIVQHMKGRV